MPVWTTCSKCQTALGLVVLYVANLSLLGSSTCDCMWHGKGGVTLAKKIRKYLVNFPLIILPSNIMNTKLHSDQPHTCTLKLNVMPTSAIMSSCRHKVEEFTVENVRCHMRFFRMSFVDSIAQYSCIRWCVEWCEVNRSLQTSMCFVCRMRRFRLESQWGAWCSLLAFWCMDKGHEQWIRSRCYPLHARQMSSR